ncbi:curli-like amyloid fiber formation chaperone CsgH [Salinibacter altiplanensis]|uniref:curli-like amyloid fiber formation chaperone CsgH n=1 Tax=Salinibacter altiplanensis TaxID=1803181 RepID=UPI000C9FB9A8|nr:curli-like amyloid fiber formation chaperone CsgH [Salinibacter altiplanensis]
MMASFSHPGIAALFSALLLLGSAGTASSSSSPDASDSTRARIDTQRVGDRLRVRGLFVNMGGPTGPLTYELSVRREGMAGTTRSSQSGSFRTAPGQTDTLSTTQVNVQSGDRIDLRLVVRRDDTPLDRARIRRTMP